MIKIEKLNDECKEILDAIPAFIFLFDKEANILHCNSAAAKLCGKNKELILLRKPGNVLGCIYSYVKPEGCGYANECQKCPIRTAIRIAFNRESFSRKSARLQLVKNNVSTDFYALITATLITRENDSFVTLIIEDISEVIALQKLIPICVKCKKIKDEDQYWK